MLVRNKNLFLSIVLAFGLFGFGAVGCTTMENVGGGTAVGAALGAGIGALVGDPGIGAAIGAGVGAMGGLAKDSMEKGQQNKANQAQNNARMLNLEIDAEIDRQVADLKESLKKEGKDPDDYRYETTSTPKGRIIVKPVEKGIYSRTEIIR